MNQDDNCRHTPNSGQQDDGGIASGPDGIGNHCQCGDVTGEGLGNDLDIDSIRDYLAGLGPLAHPDRCNVTGPADAGATDCNQVDVVVLQRAMMFQMPGAEQVCSPALSAVPAVC